MTLNVTPVAPADRQLIQRYGDQQFRISGITHAGSVLVFAEETITWSVDNVEHVTLECLQPVTDQAGDIDILLIGCGETFTVPPKPLRSGLKERGIILEWMDTGAACRTFNVLLAEERRVAAALIAV